MKNIFENAKFGDFFLTIDGRKAIYVEYNKALNLNEYHYLMVENCPNFIAYNDDGTTAVNGSLGLYIVSKWKEEIDGKELDRLANSASNELYGGFEQTKCIWESGFKAGYRKAKED